MHQPLVQQLTRARLQEQLLAGAGLREPEAAAHLLQLLLLLANLLVQPADLLGVGVLLREQPRFVLSDRLVVLLLQLEHALLEGHDLIRLLRQLSIEVLEDVLLVLLLLHEACLELLTLVAVGAALVLGEILLEQADLCLQELTVCRAAWPVDVPLLGKYGADVVIERRPEDRAPVGESQA